MLEKVKKTFPEFYNILTANQIKKLLDDDKEEQKEKRLGASRGKLRTKTPQSPQ